MTRALAATGSLLARTLRQFPRVPADFVIALVIPLFLYGLFSTQYTSVSRIPGFPADRYADFLLPQILVFAAFTSANGAGYALVLEVKSGYLDKLLAMPIPRSSILLGRVLGVGLRAVVQLLVVMGVAFLFGVTIGAGVLGALAIAALGAILSMAWACVGAFIALTLRSPEASEGLTILFLPLTYLTTGLMPLELMPRGMQVAVQANPVTYVIEGMRGLVLGDWTFAGVALAFGVVLALAVACLGAATWALRRMDV